MRAAIYSPYLDTMGGGERYVLSIAKALLDNGWSVDLEFGDEKIIDKIKSRFGFDLSGLNIVSSVNRGSGYDLCFWLSDGSVPTLGARRNILHFQRPFWRVEGKSLINRMKFMRINKVVVNSKFTKSYIDDEFPVDSFVLYPPVDVKQFKSGKKENIILYVGRFSQLEQSKKQDVLLRAFKKFHDSGNTDWKLILAGGSDVGRTKFVDRLKENAKTYPVKIIENPNFDELKNLYATAKIFWSASGYGVDDKKEANKVEHFGIAPVEAMAAGAVPFLYNAGGHREIVEEGKNGFLWKTTLGLVKKTKKLLSSEKNFRKIANNAKDDSQTYSYERFEKEFLSLL